MTSLIVLSIELLKLGGSPSEMLQTLSASTKLPAIAVIAQPRLIKSFEVNPTDASELSRVMRKEAEWVMAPGVELNFHSNTVPLELIGLLRRESRSAQAYPEPDADRFVVKGGNVKLQTEKFNGLRLENLDRSPWSKPIEMHWFYDSMVLFGAVDSAPESDFLKRVAKSAGARFRETADGYFLELDADQVRLRVANTIRPFTLNSSFPPNFSPEQRSERIYQRTLSMRALESLSRDELATLLRSRNNVIQIANRPAIVSMVRARANDLLRRYLELRQDPNNQRRGDFDYRGMNLDGPIGVEITAQFEARGLIQYRNPRTGAVTTLRI